MLLLFLRVSFSMDGSGANTQTHTNTATDVHMGFTTLCMFYMGKMKP